MFSNHIADNIIFDLKRICMIGETNFSDGLNKCCERL